MRAVWTFVVACLVAFGGAGGVGEGVDVRTAAAAADLVRPAHEAARTAAIRSASHQAPARARTRIRTQIDNGRLPPAMLAAAVSLPRPPQCALASSSAACGGAYVRRLIGGSARGPPLV